MKPIDPDKRKRKDPKKERKIKNAISLGVKILIPILIFVFSLIVPFRSFLPADEISARKEGELRIHFLCVGQADCSVVEFPDGNVLIIDSGDGAWEARNRIVRYVKGLNATRIDYLLTHPDLDHYGGFYELFQLLGGNTFYLPILETNQHEYDTMISAAQTAGLKMQTISRYGCIENASGAYLACISPRAEEWTATENDASAVLWLNYDGVSALFTGDITEGREQLLMEEYALDPFIFDSGEHGVCLEETDILKVSHHGSASGTSEAWLSLLGVETAIISSGLGNNYHHPAEELLSRLHGCETYRTDELGNIMITIKDGAYTVKYDQKTFGGRL